MNKLSKVIKINFLSLIALLLLLTATILKMIAKTMEKIFIILGIGVFYVILVLIFEFIKEPTEALNMMFAILLGITVLGAIIAIFLSIAGILSGIAYFVIECLKSLFDWIYSKLYFGYSSLITTCNFEYEELNKESANILYYFVCFFYSIVNGIHKGIIFFLYYAPILSGILSIAFVIFFFKESNAIIDTTLGISLIQFFKLYQVIDQIYICIISVVLVGSIIGILFMIGFEWREWGNEMITITSNYQAYIEAINQEREELIYKEINRSTEDAEYQKAIRYYERLIQHVNEFSVFMKDIQSAIINTRNMSLKADYNEYATLLQELCKHVSNYNSEIELNDFLNLISKIDKVDQLKTVIIDQISREEKKCDSIYFTGCSTKERLEKRYKALCKTYHPDMEYGDEDTFKKMSDEYEKLLKRFEG